MNVEMCEMCRPDTHALHQLYPFLTDAGTVSKVGDWHGKYSGDLPWINLL